MTPSELIAIYNRVIESRGLKRHFRISAAMMSGVRDFLAWCEINSVDPERWIRARHDAVQYRRRIRFDQLKSDKFLPKFRAWGDQHQVNEVMQDRISKSAQEVQSYSGIGYLAETIKRNTVPEVCMYDSLTVYSEESKVCGSCRLRRTCAGG